MSEEMVALIVAYSNLNTWLQYRRTHRKTLWRPMANKRIKLCIRDIRKMRGVK